jgi:hypothetical protein
MFYFSIWDIVKPDLSSVVLARYTTSILIQINVVVSSIFIDTVQTSVLVGSSRPLHIQFNEVSEVQLGTVNPISNESSLPSRHQLGSGLNQDNYNDENGLWILCVSTERQTRHFGRNPN